MSEFLKLDANQPATLGAVVEAIAHLSTLDESEIVECVSAGKIRDIFPFRAHELTDLGPDTVAKEDLIGASAMPLSREDRAALIQASMPTRKARPRSASRRSRKLFFKS